MWQPDFTKFTKSLESITKIEKSKTLMGKKVERKGGEGGVLLALLDCFVAVQKNNS